MTCDGKVCYSKHKAKEVCLTVMKKRNRKIRTYECPKCNSWNLTSKMDDM